MSVRNSVNILLDDWPLVQIRGRIVSSGSNQFDTPSMRSVIRLCSNKCWQE
jgi:hypothetical protein